MVKYSIDQALKAIDGVMAYYDRTSSAISAPQSEIKRKIYVKSKTIHAKVEVPSINLFKEVSNGS